MVRISTLATSSSGLVARIVVLTTDVEGSAIGDIIFFLWRIDNQNYCSDG